MPNIGVVTAPVAPTTGIRTALSKPADDMEKHALAGNDVGPTFPVVETSNAPVVEISPPAATPPSQATSPSPDAIV